MIKRLLASALVTATLLGPIAARAEDVDGTILLPNPLAVTQGIGLAEAVGACDPSAATQGIDGFWIPLPAGANTIALTTADPVADLSLWFYDAACGYLSGHDDTATGGEGGAVPSDADWVIVDMLVGLNASFSVSIS